MSMTSELINVGLLFNDDNTMMLTDIVVELLPHKLKFLYTDSYIGTVEYQHSSIEVYGTMEGYGFVGFEYSDL